MALTPKQQRFCEEYLIDLNATQAAIRAGYSERTAQEQSSRLLSNVMVKAWIDAAIKEREEQSKVKAADVLNEISRLAFSDLGQIMDFEGDTLKLKKPSDIPVEARRAIASVKVKRYFEGNGEDAKEVELVEFKLWNKDAALEKLARHLGLLKDGTTVNVSVPFKVYKGFDPESV